MQSVSIYVPGSNLPLRTSQAAKLRKIRAQAKASAAVVDLLARLAFGDDPEAGWPAMPPVWAGPALAESVAHG